MAQVSKIEEMSSKLFYNENYKELVQIEKILQKELCFTLYEISLFSLGIILGLVLFAFVSATLGKKFYEFEQKFQNKIKIALGSVVMLIAISLLFLGVGLKNTTFFYLNLKKDFFLYNYP